MTFRTLLPDPVTPENRRLENPNYNVVISPDNEPPIVASLPESFEFSLSSNYQALMGDGIETVLPGTGAVKKAVQLAGYGNLTTRFMTAKVWQGSNSGSISLEISLHAETDSYKDVTEPLLRLMKLVTPKATGTNGGGFFKTPGPSLDVAGLTADALNKISNSSLSGLSDGFTSLVNTNTESSTDSKFVNSISKGFDIANNAAAEVNDYMEKNIRNNISITIGNYIRYPSVVITGISNAIHVKPLEDGTFSFVKVTLTFEPFYAITDLDLDRMFASSASTDRSRTLTSPSLSTSLRAFDNTTLDKYNSQFDVDLNIPKISPSLGDLEV